MPQHEVVACFVCYDATSHIPRRSNDDVDYRMCDRCLSLSENHNWLMETDWDGKKSSPKKILPSRRRMKPMIAIPNEAATP